MPAQEVSPVVFSTQEFSQPQVAESIIPEQPQYPPSPEFYAQMPVARPLGEPAIDYSMPAPAAFVPPVHGMPVFSPPSGYGYGLPAPGYGYALFPPERPLPLGQAIRELPGQYKKIILKPGARSFAEEQHKADWGIIWMQILFLMILNIVISIPDYFVNQALFSSTSTSSASASLALSTLSGSLIGAFFVPVGIFAVVGIQYLMVKMFKGVGSFKRQMYTYLLFYVPIQVIASVISLFSTSLTIRAEQTLFSSLNALSTSTTATTPPDLFSGLSGGLLLGLGLVEIMLLALGVYSIVLNVFSLMAAHRLSGGKATGAVLIPIAALVVLVGACYCALIVAVIGMVSSAHP